MMITMRIMTGFISDELFIPIREIMRISAFDRPSSGFWVCCY